MLARGSVWRESVEIDPPWIGAPHAPITLGTYGQGRLPVITGTDLATSFRPACGSLCYEADVPGPVMRVFMDGNGFVADHRHAGSGDLVPGSWAWSDGRLYLRLPQDSPPSRHRIEVTHRQWGIRCWGCRDAVFEGVEIWGTWDDGVNIDGPVGDKATARVTVRQCDIHDIGRGDYDETGVQAGSTYARAITVEANKIYRIGLGQGFGARIGAGGIGILFNRCDDCAARNNDVHDAGHIGIAAQITEEGAEGPPEPHQITIVANKVHDCPGIIPGLDRADAIYLRRATAVRVAGNEIWNVASPVAGAGNGVHIGPQCGDITIADNTIGESAGAIYIDGDPRGPVAITANRFNGVGLFFVRLGQPMGAIGGDLSFDGNIYGGPAPSAPFVVGTTGETRLNFAQWRALGRDRDGTIR